MTNGTAAGVLTMVLLLQLNVKDICSHAHQMCKVMHDNKGGRMTFSSSDISLMLMQQKDKDCSQALNRESKSSLKSFDEEFQVKLSNSSHCVFKLTATQVSGPFVSLVWWGEDRKRTTTLSEHCPKVQEALFC